MLDSGIAKMGIFAFILLLSFAGLISIIPSQFVYGYEYGNPSDKIPETWNGIELGGYNFTESWNTTITTIGDTEIFDIGGRNLLLQWDSRDFPYRREMRLSHRYGFLLLFEEDLEWFNTDGEAVFYLQLGYSFIGHEELNENFEEFGNLEFETLCRGLGSGSTYFKLTVLFSFNTTSYETPEIAWNNDDLDILIGINAENTNWQKDIWYLISNLLTFNTLYVFGSTEIFAVVLNGILASIIYAPIIIFATAIILEVLPF